MQYHLNSQLLAIHHHHPHPVIMIDRSIKDRLKAWKQIYSNEQSTPEQQFIREHLSQPLVKQYILGHSEPKPSIIHLLQLISPPPATLLSISTAITNFVQVTLAIDILQLLSDKSGLEQQVEYLLGQMHKQLQKWLHIIDSKQFRVKQLDKVVEILRGLNTLVRSYQLKDTSNLQNTLHQFLINYQLLSKQILCQLYLLSLYLNPKQQQPTTNILQIHYLNAHAIIHHTPILSRLLPMIQTLKQSQHKYQLACVLGKAFQLEYQSYGDKDDAFDQIIPLFESGRSAYPYLQTIITYIVKYGGQWSLEGSLQRKFFIARILIKYIQCSTFIAHWPSFLSDSFTNAGNLSVAYSAETIELYLLKLHHELKDDEKWVMSWIAQYQKCLTTNNKNTLKGLVEFINPIIVKICPKPIIPQKLLNNNIAEGQIAMISLIKCYRDIGKISTDNQKRILYFTQQPSIYLNYNRMQKMLLSSDIMLSDKCLQLVAHLSKPSQLLKPVQYQLLLQFYNNSLKTSSAQFRKNYLNTTRLLMEKLRSNYQKQLSGKSNKKPYYQHMKEFIIKIVKICFENVYVDAIYQIVQPALQILIIIVKYFAQHLQLKTGQKYAPTNLLSLTTFHQQSTFQNLLGCLSSSYQSIRTSASILLNYYNSIVDHQLLNKLWMESLSHTNKLPIRQFEYACRVIVFLSKQYDSIIPIPKIYKLSHLNICHFLLQLLRDRYSVFSTQFTKQSPVYYSNLIHGVLTCLSYIFEDISTINIPKQSYEQFKQLMEEILTQVTKILIFSVEISSSSVSTVVLDTFVSEGVKGMKVDCRGHFITDNVAKHLQSTALMSSMEDDQEGIQNTMVVSFYLLTRQAGLLFQSIASLLNSNQSLNYLPINSLIKLIHSYFYALINLKHMGSVDRISIGLLSMSKIIFKHQNKQLTQIPQNLLNKLVTLLQEGTFTNILRRSAGVPFAFCCLLKSEDIKRKSLIQKTIQILLKLSSKQQNKIQQRIHSLNILKKLFQDSDLKQDLDQYVSDAFITSMEGFSSQNWGVRNSSLMLFSTLANRTVGIKPTFNLVQFFHKCPKLLDFMIQQLPKPTIGVMYPSLYPLVLLLSRLLPFDVKDKTRVTIKGTFKQIRKQQLLKMLPLLEKAGDNPNLMGRAMTAKAILPFLETTQIINYCLNILTAFPMKSTNLSHFKLLSVYHLLQSYYQIFPQGITHSQQILTVLITKLKYLRLIKCYPIQQLLIKIYHTLILNNCNICINAQIDRSPMIKDLIHLLLTYWHNVNNYQTMESDLGGSQMRLSLIKFTLCIIINKVDLSHHNNNYSFLSTFIKFLTNKNKQETTYMTKVDSQVIDTYLEYIFMQVDIGLHLRNILQQWIDGLNENSIPDNTLIWIIRITIKLENKFKFTNYLRNKLSATLNSKLEVQLFKYFQWLGQQQIDLLIKFSNPQSLQNLRQCCVEHLSKCTTIKPQLYLVCLRLLEDEQPEIRKQASKQISRCLAISNSNDSVLKIQILSKMDFQQCKKLIYLNSDYEIKKKNNSEQRIFSYDKPNKYRSDIQNIIQLIKYNKNVTIKQIQSIFEGIKIQQSLNNYCEDILNRNEYKFQNILRSIIINPKKYADAAKIHPKFQTVYNIVKNESEKNILQQ